MWKLKECHFAWTIQYNNYLHNTPQFILEETLWSRFKVYGKYVWVLWKHGVTFHDRLEHLKILTILRQSHFENCVIIIQIWANLHRVETEWEILAGNINETYVDENNLDYISFVVWGLKYSLGKWLNCCNSSWAEIQFKHVI